MVADDKVHDPTVLRAIAHPVRNRILGELSAAGSSRAADVARELDIPANTASFHLRQLAKYGLVEEDVEAARDKRDRVWRLVHPDGFELNLENLDASSGTQVVDVYRRTLATRAQKIVAAAMSPSPEDRDRHQTVSDYALKLTRDEAKELAGEIDALVRGWAERTRGRDEARRTYLLFQVLTPYPDDL